ncbi:uncharacterized protein LOC124696173 [Lolium rigidum]|uniref:uncharacterized protein LOC124696173 n=1 Tax=Lolium rigidum TaxID=89674 RepID=UPI001F5CCB1A|nr:uncharacterized protein LOC124696173 [Lolium rigidum]
MESASPLLLPFVPITDGEARNAQEPVVTDPPPPAKHQAAPQDLSGPIPIVTQSLSSSPSWYRASSAQEPVVFPLSGSGPPVLVSLVPVMGPGGMMRSRFDEKTGVNFIQLSDEFHQKRTPAQKFYLEPSKLHPELLHVRCADGNKYLVAQEHDTTLFITANADEPEEDITKPSCTLFNFSNTEYNAFTIIKHKNKNIMVSLFDQHGGDGSDNICMQLRRDYYGNALFRVVRLSEQKELPKYVRIKGSNDKYLQPTNSDIRFYNADNSECWFHDFRGSDGNDKEVIFETFTDDFGLIRFRHYPWGNVCRSVDPGDGKGIACTVHDWNYEIDTNISQDTIYKVVDSLFKVVIKEGNNIALQSVSNGKFCKLLTTDMHLTFPGHHYKWHPLQASASSSYPRETTLRIEEAAKSRQIYDVQYRFEGQKIRDAIQVSRHQVIGTNVTSQTIHLTNTVEMFNSVESRWDSMVSLDVGVKTSMSVDFPGIAEFSSEIHVDFHGEYSWGKTEGNSKKSTTTVEYNVPPMSRIVCTIYAKVVEIDVPFSYKVKDILFDGKEGPPRQMHDGMYRGVNSTDIDIKVKTEEM